MQAYISLSYAQKSVLSKELEAIKKILTGLDIHPFIFIDRYTFAATEERQMMQGAFLAIDQSDFLLAETSEKAIGVGIEAGYARAKNKPVIYLRKSAAEHSTTLSGTSDYQIIYASLAELEQQLILVLRKLLMGN